MRVCMYTYVSTRVWSGAVVRTERRSVGDNEKGYSRRTQDQELHRRGELSLKAGGTTR